MKCPCKECFHRTLTCHGFCKGYKEWKAWLDEKNEKKRKEIESTHTHHPNKEKALRKKMRWK